MKTNARSFKLGVLGAVSAGAVALAFYGCSSSSSPATTGTGDDAGTDAGGSSPQPDSGGTVTQPDSGGGTPTADSGGGSPDGGSLILQGVTETDLFSDQSGKAPHVDPNLLNAWGLAFNPGAGIAWVSDNHAGVATLYSTADGGAIAPLVVQVPLPDGGGGALYPALDSGTVSAPTGQIFNASATPDAGTTNDFMGDAFIISAEDGTISGWASSLADRTKAKLRVDMSSSAASFKGLQIIPSTPPVLLAADFHNGKIDAFDANYAPVTAAAGKWTDPSIPAGYAPYNIYTDGTKVYVAYAKQDSMAGDDQPGQGFGAITTYDLTGTLVKSLVPQNANNGLNGPWGMTTVPAGGWGKLPAGALLVGNFEGGAINAFDSTTGAALGSLVKSDGTPLTIDGLWALTWGPNTPGAAAIGTLPTQLFFTAGPNDEADGLYGYLTAQ
ncbi:MAG TPA: TIGR03118 family protein [Polyangiaceae bacterium]|jgi:uncharacterized protein (TIGR03118 family)|nr:TIGR03118 family protein [Polyangiaceae bacterium]